jgi:hypothetical protein
MRDNELEARLQIIGVEVMLRLGLDPHRWRKYLGLLEEEVMRHEIRKTLARMEEPEFEPLEPVLHKDDDDDAELEECVWKKTPNF